MKQRERQTLALAVGAFFDELVRWGVRDVVISPGSRSTPLAMTAYELSRRHPELLRLVVDVDERGAAFYALGAAKASGRPVVFICTSGTATANAHPAVMEAATSRVSLIMLTGDRPLRLQGLGAPQTTDQLKLYGDLPHLFCQMPLPADDDKSFAFFRQSAREACLAAMGPGAVIPFEHGALDESSLKKPSDTSSARSSEGDNSSVIAARGCAQGAGPVQVNFPFDEPLVPDFNVEGLFTIGRGPDMGEAERRGLAAEATLVEEVAAYDAEARLPLPPLEAKPLSSWSATPIARVSTRLASDAIRRIEVLLASGNAMLLAGEGSCETVHEAETVLGFARRFRMPIIADPLSGLRSFNDQGIMDAYDRVFGMPGCPQPDVVVRFGRYPVSKQTVQALEARRPIQIVVDRVETRDYTCATDLFVPSTPLDFAASPWVSAATSAQRGFLEEWIYRNDMARDSVNRLVAEGVAVEGAYVEKLLQTAPRESLIFAANSMTVRAFDTFYQKESKPLAFMGNRGLNGIDGTLSSAFGAARSFSHTTVLIGDLAMLHDMNALALQRELKNLETPRSIVVVLLNNNGGAIFDMLPQASNDPYFERLFLTPQDVSFQDVAKAFSVPYALVKDVDAFGRIYRQCLERSGISLIEVPVPLRGVDERYGQA